jgi:hypothetical protein
MPLAPREIEHRRRRSRRAGRVGRLQAESDPPALGEATGSGGQTGMWPWGQCGKPQAADRSRSQSRPAGGRSCDAGGQNAEWVGHSGAPGYSRCRRRGREVHGRPSRVPGVTPSPRSVIVGVGPDLAACGSLPLDVSRYRSAARRQPLPGWGTPPPDGPLVQGAGGPTGSATNFETSTPASVEPAEGPADPLHRTAPREK